MIRPLTPCRGVSLRQGVRLKPMSQVAATVDKEFSK